ncbi:MAG TPA: enolase C-terminal domain-like protein, partial [Spirochaetia bacterium]|nr:enolase C-terminal domain-like protein [Spirochaetia bacterium]
MKITDMRVTPIAMGDPPLLNAAGLHAPYALRTIVELVSDDGISGVGEVPGGAVTTSALEAAREAVVGADPFARRANLAALEAIAGRLDWSRTTLMRVSSAVDVASHDLIGKAIGKPVVDLLGGAVRERVEFAAYLFYKDEGAGGESATGEELGARIDPSAGGWPAARQARAHEHDEVVAQARAMCDEYGFGSIKLKGGVFSPDHEVATIRALREAFGPDVPLRLDPNAVWSVETAVKAGEQLVDLLEYYEDPVRGQEAMAEVARRLDLPLATNMCTVAFEHLPQSVRLGSERIILVDHHAWGGLLAAVELDRICATFGRELSMHSNSHLGISLAAMTHLAAASPSLAYAVDTHYPWQSDEVIVGGRFVFDGGSLPVSREPGLGVELDRDALARL